MDNVALLWGKLGASRRLVQFIYTLDGITGPPDAEGNPSGNSLLVVNAGGDISISVLRSALAIPENSPWLTSIHHTCYLEVGFYIRAVNTSQGNIGPGIYYGESSLYQITNQEPIESWDCTGAGSRYKDISYPRTSPIPRPTVRPTPMTTATLTLSAAPTLSVAPTPTLSVQNS